MIVNWDLILNDLSVRLKDGIPDFQNEQHIIKLWDVLKEHKWPIDARVQLIQTLQEKDIVKNKKSGNTYVVKTHNPDTQDIVTKNASDDEIKAVKKGKEDARTSEPISGINDIQTDLENKRDKGVAGAGGPVASQGEARYCNAMNNHDDDKFIK